MYIIKFFYKSNNTISHAKPVVHLLHSYDLSPNAKIYYINRLYTHFNLTKYVNRTKHILDVIFTLGMV